MKSYDSIIAVGCSGMFGYEHTDTNNNQTPSKQTWVNFIGNKLNLPVYNFSLSGGSNQTILRRLYFAVEFTKNHNLTPLFVVQWTSLQRYETFLSSAYYRCNDWPWIRPLLEIFHSSNDKTLTNWAKKFYNLFDDQTLMFESIKTVEHGNLLLQTNNYPIINCLDNSWNLEKYEINNNTHFVASNEIEKSNPYNSTLETVYQEKSFDLNHNMLKQYETIGYISQGNDKVKYEAYNHLLWNKIESYPWWHYDQNPFTYSLKDYAVDNNLPIGPEGHPLELANQSAAEYAWNSKSFQKLLNY